LKADERQSLINARYVEEQKQKNAQMSEGAVSGGSITPAI
jgi:hypothetical protein